MKTLYEELGVTPLASHTVIQQSYFRLVKKLDPKSPLRQGGEHTREQYLAVQNAYRTLSNSQLRADYDRSLQMQVSKAGVKNMRPANGERKSR